MEVLLIGAGQVASRLNLTLVQHGHQISAQIPNLTPQMLNGFDARVLIVVSPECSISIDTLVNAAEKGRFIFVISGGSDPVTAWANSVGVPTYAYPPSELDINHLLGELRRAEAGTVATDDQYRRAVLGSEMAARLQSGMAIRKIAVTSPKGGTGKTTIAVNMAVSMALCGISTYLVDADANAGALGFHLRLPAMSENLISLIRRETAAKSRVMSGLAAGASLLPAFSQIDNLPSLRALPGITTDNLADPVFSDEEGLQRINEVIEGLYNIGPASNGITIMDVGINPAHPLHSAALRHAESIVIVIKPEVPDLAETLRWLRNIMSEVTRFAGHEAAHEFVTTRVKICYNQVYDGSFKKAHNDLRQAVREMGIDFDIVPNGIIPFVDPKLATDAVNSERREHILIWRAKKEHPEELRPFAEALISFTAHFVPTITEAAKRVGIIQVEENRRRLRNWFGL